MKALISDVEAGAITAEIETILNNHNLHYFTKIHLLLAITKVECDNNGIDFDTAFCAFKESEEGA